MNSFLYELQYFHTYTIFSKRSINIESITQLAEAAAKAIDDLKGRDIVILEVAEVSSIADYFIIATGDGPVHINALANRVRQSMTALENKMSHTEGFDSKNWVLLDYYSIVVHIFSEEAREYYALENLWGDAKQLPLEDGRLQNVI